MHNGEEIYSEYDQALPFVSRLALYVAAEQQCRIGLFRCPRCLGEVSCGLKLNCNQQKYILTRSTY